MWLRGRKGRKYTNKKVGTTCGTLQHSKQSVLNVFIEVTIKKEGKMENVLPNGFRGHKQNEGQNA